MHLPVDSLADCQRLNRWLNLPFSHQLIDKRKDPFQRQIRLDVVEGVLDGRLHGQHFLLRCVREFDAPSKDGGIFGC
jgi:hypothetical protein